MGISINVLVIHVGGTIGMKQRDGCLKVEANHLAKYISSSEELNNGTDDYTFETEEGRMKYKLIEFKELKDSSDFGIDDWLELLKKIESNYDDYDAFGCLHGTDTMAYTSSALSFLIENLSKPIILTGAAHPFDHPDSDALNNLKGMFNSFLDVHLNNKPPKVYVYYNGKLMAGNKISKFISADQIYYNEIESENFEKPKGDVKFYHNMSRNITVRKLFPGIKSEELLDDFLTYDGIVIESFGCGNIPLNLLKVIRQHSKTTVIVNISQVLKGIATADYENGYRLNTETSIICGGDMTSEAAYTKLSFLLGNFDSESKEAVKEKLRTNIRGEMSDKSSIL